MGYKKKMALVDVSIDIGIKRFAIGVFRVSPVDEWIAIPYLGCWDISGGASGNKACMQNIIILFRLLNSIAYLLKTTRRVYIEQQFIAMKSGIINDAARHIEDYVAVYFAIKQLRWRNKIEIIYVPNRLKVRWLGCPYKKKDQYKAWCADHAITELTNRGFPLHANLIATTPQVRGKRDMGDVICQYKIAPRYYAQDKIF